MGKLIRVLAAFLIVVTVALPEGGAPAVSQLTDWGGLLPASEGEGWCC